MCIMWLVEKVFFSQIFNSTVIKHVRNNLKKIQKSSNTGYQQIQYGIFSKFECVKRNIFLPKWSKFHMTQRYCGIFWYGNLNFTWMFDIPSIKQNVTFYHYLPTVKCIIFLAQDFRVLDVSFFLQISYSYAWTYLLSKKSNFTCTQ